MAFVDHICELSRRGAMQEIANSIREYWVDKKAAPWHRIYDMLDKNWNWKSGDKEEFTQRLLLLRDGVFGSLGMLSLSLAIDLSTKEVLHILTKSKDWNSGRRDVRSRCAKILSEMISKKQLADLLPSALERDGFGFLVPSLKDALFEEYRDAQPRITRKKLDVSLLSKSVLGRSLLREQMITESKIAEEDPRTQQLLETYERLLVELELDERVVILPPSETDQLTLNGEVVAESQKEKERERVVDTSAVELADLTEFLEAENAKAAKKKKRPAKTRTTKTKKKTTSKKKGGSKR